MKALLFLAVVLALTSTSLATHFRYQTLYWERPTADSKVLTVTLKQAWRWSAFGNPAVGTTVNTGTITWGDGGSASIAGVVVSTNAADDWFFHQQVFTKTYSNYGNFTITFSDCCRISTLKDGNNDRSQVVSTKIVLTNGGALRSPQIASLPLIPFQINQNNSIQLPLIKDEQNNDVTFSITPASASGLNLASPSAAYTNAIFPFALTAGGIIKWNPNTAGLYAFQTTATATNGNAVTLDVILMVSTAQADHSPPYWTAPTQTEVHFTPGQLVTFTVAAKEDEIDDIHVQAGSLPPGATLSGCQGAPVQGRFNPCTTTFSWQTTATSTDTIVCFQANDAVGNYAPQLCVTLIADTSAGTCGPNCVVKTVASSCTDSGNPISHHASGTCATLSFSNTASQC